MKIFQILAIAVLGVSFALLIRPLRPELSMMTGIVTGILVLLMAIGELTGVVDALRQIAADHGIDSGYVGTLLKIIGIAYMAQFGAQICKDAGESAVAGKVELCGRILILACALPVTMTTISTAIGMLKSMPQ
ncbi:MAG: stage III sporulation protein AD [Clostridia bacterium]